MDARVWLSLGSNIDREHNMRTAVSALEQRFSPLIVSQVYESEAVGFDGEPFYNMVVGLDTDLPVDQLKQYLHELEMNQGRDRTGRRFAPRTLDIDLLTYGDTVLDSAYARLPRDEILRYAFVLRPLSEVAGDERHPLDGRSYRELWAAFDQPDQPLWPVALEFPVGIGRGER